MTELHFTKNSVDLKQINSFIEDFCNQNNINSENVTKIQLVSEEYLSNILFPNYEGEVSFSISKIEEIVKFSFVYEGKDYTNKINDSSILALRIIENKTKSMKSVTDEGKTTVEFEI